MNFLVRTFLLAPEQLPLPNSPLANLDWHKRVGNLSD